MTERLASVTAALTLGATALVASAVEIPLPRAGQESPQRFRTSADAVSVEVSVRRQNRPVTGLKAADFEIVDNGVPQEVTEIGYEKLPIDVTVVLDVSASVTGSVLDQLRRSVRQLRADLGARDRLKLVAFNMRIRRLADFAEPVTVSDAAFGSIAGSGGSAIFDALAVALTTPAPAGRRQLIVLFSDGVDSSSISDPEALFDVARRSTPTVAVVLASPVPNVPATTFVRPPDQGPITIARMYDRLANETGGSVVPTRAEDNLGVTFRRILGEFRASYVLYFTPRGVEPTGVHTLDVRVKRAGVDVRARRGYVWR
jgi:VWFA-related protein